MYDNSVCMKALMDGTNLSSTGNPSVKTVKTITRYVIKPLTYLFYRLTLHEYSYRCSVVMTTALAGACVLITDRLRHHLAL